MVECVQEAEESESNEYLAESRPNIQGLFIGGHGLIGELESGNDENILNRINKHDQNENDTRQNRKNQVRICIRFDEFEIQKKFWTRVGDNCGYKL